MEPIKISSIVNNALKELALEIDKNNVENGKLEGEEISIFGSEANKLIAQGKATAQEVGEIFGFEKSAPAAGKTVTTPAELSKKDTKRNRESVKGEVEAFVKSNVRPEQLMERLNQKFTNPEYKAVLNDVEHILALVNATNYNSKDDVKKIHDTVKKQLKAENKWEGFHKDILSALEAQAEKTQIQKEYEGLRARYMEIKSTMAGTEIVKERGDNFKAYVEILKDELQTKGADKKKEWNKSYTEEAFKYVERYAQGDAMQVAQERLDKKTEGGSHREIRSEMKKLNKGKDDYQKDAIKDLKQDRRSYAAKHNYENAKNEMATITREKIQKELGKEVFEKLNRSYLATVRNQDGTYNLSGIAEAIQSRAGIDYTVSRNDSDSEMAELTHVGRHLRRVTGQEFTKSELKDLIKLSGIKYERKDRSGKAIMREAFDLPSAAGGAVTGAVMAPYVSVTQDAILRFTDAAQAEEILKQLSSQGVQYDKTMVGEGINVKLHQSTKVNMKPLGALAGVLTEAATKGLWALAFGVSKDEPSCISISDYDINDTKYTDAKQYKEYISQTYKNPTKVDAIHSLVDNYVQAYGDDWHTHYQQGLREMAGIGSKLNPAECSMMKYQKVDIPTPPHNDEVNNNDDECVDDTCSANIRPTEESFTYTKRGGDTWKGMVEAFYPCLTEDGTPMYNQYAIRNGKKVLVKEGAITKLKRALSVDANGNFDPEIFKKLRQGGDLPKVMILPAKIENCERVNAERGVKYQVHGTGKAKVQRVGNGDAGFIATDDCDVSQTAKGKTRQEALNNLKTKTGKTYNNEAELLK